MARPRQHVPLHAELAPGLPRRLDEAHLEHDLLRLRNRDRVDHVGSELLRHRQRAIEHDAVGRPARQQDAAVDRRHAELGGGKPARQLTGERGDVVGNLDVEDADQLLALAVHRHPRGADLLAEDRDGLVGQRIDVGDLRIAHQDVDEARVGAHVLRLADRHLHRDGALAGADLQQPLRLGLAGEACQAGRGRERHGGDEGEHHRAPVDALAMPHGPVHVPGARRPGAIMFLLFHIGLPAL